MKISVTIGMLLIITLFVASGHANDQPKARNAVIHTGLASSNALTTLAAILKLVPQDDTLLDIRFTSPTNIEVRLCGEDARQGCTRRYEKIDGEWKLGIITKCIQRLHRTTSGCAPFVPTAPDIHWTDRQP